jgi:hypothetical protein
MRLDHVGQDQGIKDDKHPEAWGEVGDEVVDSKDKIDVTIKDLVDRYLFIWLIIRTFRLVFSARTVFFSHNELANNIF